MHCSSKIQRVSYHESYQIIQFPVAQVLGRAMRASRTRLAHSSGLVLLSFIGHCSCCLKVGDDR